MLRGFVRLATVSAIVWPICVATSSVASASPEHLVVGFNATSASLVADAASLGITTDVLYNGPPKLKSRFGRALAGAHMGVIDASISTDLYFWECHRTHTVAPPPAGEANSYCRRDYEPNFDTAVLLSTVAAKLSADASNPLVDGYWVLDDWPAWDGGSAQVVLQQIHEEIAAETPGYPAICGFGGTIGPPGPAQWDPSTAANYSTAGCDMVGLYNYANVTRKSSTGSSLDWAMQSLLPAMEASLAAQGWSAAAAPMLGIGQAWSGHFAGGYQPGLSASQVLTEASAFCGAGAGSIGWYGWTDGGFHRNTQTPANASAIDSGIQESIAACQADWAGG